MKRIFFNNSMSVFNIVTMVVGITAVIALNFVKDIPYEQLYWYKISAYGLVVLYFLKIIVQNLMLRNFVGWTSRSIQIKIGTRVNTVIAFSEVKRHSFNNGILTVKTDDKDYTFDLKNYNNKDIKKLLGIFDKYSK